LELTARFHPAFALKVQNSIAQANGLGRLDKMNGRPEGTG